MNTSYQRNKGKSTAGYMTSAVSSYVTTQSVARNTAIHHINRYISLLIGLIVLLLIVAM